jgi:hypothetical protein
MLCDDLSRSEVCPRLLAVHRDGPRGVVTRVVVHVRGDGPDWRVSLLTAATPEEILGELRRPDGLAVLTGSDGIVTLLNVAHVGWLTVEPGEPTPQTPAPPGPRPSR